ncbi:SH3 domain-containing protein [Alkalihalobacillus trypoxylicola]|uniref:SH3b domain-containing protein n=1 Tax=Alkalihalobacillus trypoxylicola TaxID=519424 RepID=A0A161QLA5_9BACI|nr:SH3 domain-containing protein [Alkalihalobacillus trypoxylicola]KYG30869.1 hypothetical protein AZF04_18665 [Alkalihalobacillus trypoxylicola]
MLSRKSFNIFIAFILIIVLFTPFSFSVEAQSLKTYQTNISYEKALEKQLSLKGQTDQNYDAFIRADALTRTGKVGTVNTGANGSDTRWNVRGGPSTNEWIIGQAQSGERLTVIDSLTGSDGYTWYKVQYNKMWVNASPTDIEYYLNPNNFSTDSAHFYQFLNLSQSSQITSQELNQSVLNGKGAFQGHGQSFVNASQKHQINEIYLISHALLETGNGHSELANGIIYNGVKVYNMYGIGAFDGCAKLCGAQYAYNQGWTTPEQAIEDGAKFVAANYIKNGQDTLYKMRWNPDNPGYNQYATDVAWAVKQTNRMANLYSNLINHSLSYEIPHYPNQPGGKPQFAQTSNEQFEPKNALPFSEQTVGETITRVNFRTEPNTSFDSFVRTIASGVEISITGENKNGWYKVKLDQEEGWMASDYIQLKNAFKVDITSGTLNVRETPDGPIKDHLQKGELLTATIKNNQIHQSGDWIEVLVNNETGWVHTNYIQQLK